MWEEKTLFFRRCVLRDRSQRRETHIRDIAGVSVLHVACDSAHEETRAAHVVTMACHKLRALRLLWVRKQELESALCWRILFLLFFGGCCMCECGLVMDCHVMCVCVCE